MKIMKNRFFAVMTLMCGLFLPACGSSGTDSPGLMLALLGGFSAPAGLESEGSLELISLTWNKVMGADGYNVYRSENGTDFDKITASPITNAAYDDAIASPAGDGVLYYYRVTALKDGEESDPSGTVKNIHGTRLAASNPAGFTTITDDSPYVAEGRVTVDGGNLTVDTGTKLYVLDGAVIDMQNSTGSSYGCFIVMGLLRVLASSMAPASFTAHDSDGGALEEGEGFQMTFNGAVDYNTGDDSGTLVQNTNISKLIVSTDPFRITDCAPRFYNTKFSTTDTSNAAEFSINAAARFQHCRFDGMAIQIIEFAPTGTTFLFEYNILMPGSLNYSFNFVIFASPGIDAGQIVNNDVDGTLQVDLGSITGSTNIPMGGNYWRGGSGTPPVPTIRQQGGTTVTCDFTTALSAAPSGAGPDW